MFKPFQLGFCIVWFCVCAENCISCKEIDESQAFNEVAGARQVPAFNGNVYAVSGATTEIELDNFLLGMRNRFRNFLGNIRTRTRSTLERLRQPEQETMLVAPTAPAVQQIGPTQKRRPMQKLRERMKKRKLSKTTQPPQLQYYGALDQKFQTNYEPPKVMGTSVEMWGTLTDVGNSTIPISGLHVDHFNRFNATL